MVAMTAEDLAALRGGLLAFCYQLLGSPFDAEDVVQDTMERAWRARDTFDPAVASLSAWTQVLAAGRFRRVWQVSERRSRLAPYPAPHGRPVPGLQLRGPPFLDPDHPGLQ